jgi:hypothetical protein
MAVSVERHPKLTGFEARGGTGNTQGVRLTGFENAGGEGGTHTQGTHLTGFER